jgi:hypothetical protein
MSDPLLDPIKVKVEWHRFLYRSVLLEWETVLHQRKSFPRFNGRKPVAGITLLKFEGLTQLRQHFESQPVTQKPSESLLFYSKATALKDLFKLIRNCVAHGHYSSPRTGWILFHHLHEKKLKLTGQVKFSNFQALITAMAPDNASVGGSSAN